MFKNKQILRGTLALTAFLILSFSLGLSYKDKSMQAAAGNSSANLQEYQVSVGAGKTATEKVDISKLAQQLGASPDQVSNLISKAISSNASGGACPMDLGSIKVQHSLCKPAGPGRCSGDPKKPGKDMCLCAATGVQGGSIQGICIQGCCRFVSATSAQDAVKNSGIMQGGNSQMFGMLGQTLGTMLQQLMQGGGSGGDGGYYSGDYNYPLQEDIDYSDMDINIPNTDFGEYVNPENTTTVTSQDVSVTDKESGTNADNSSQSPDDLIETLLVKHEKEAASTATEIIGQQTDDELIKTQEVPVETEIQEVNNSGVYDLEFQDLEKKQNNNPKVAALRDPDKSKVRSYQQYEPEFEDQKKLEQKSWWQSFIDWIFGN